MNTAKIDFKKLFKVFVVFSIYYNGYRYFFPWENNFKPLSPFYISILKDIPWALIIIFGLYGLFQRRESDKGEIYIAWKYFNSMTYLFIITHLVLLVIAIIHLYHKDLIDVLQRDIKNVQYIFLPIFFTLLFKREKDFTSYFNLIVGSGVLASLFGFITYFFIPQFTWNGEALSTFQSPNNYGFFTSMLSLLVFSKIIVEKEISTYWHIIFCILFGALLTSVSISALLSLLTGIIFIIAIARPTLRIILRFSIYFFISSLLFFYLGLFTAYSGKIDGSFSSYKTPQAFYQKLPTRSPEHKLSSSVWELLSNPYKPEAANSYHMFSRHTSIVGRVVYLHEFANYLRTANFKDILLGDFSLKHYFEYDNVYFYFIRNDGIIITLLFFSLLCSGFYVGLKKHLLFRKAGNNRMAGLLLGITAFLLTSIIIQFNLSYCLTIYPLNFLTYFFLLLIFFINPLEYRANGVNDS